MKTKKGFNLRSVCGESIIVAEGEENIDFSNIISMNESSTYLWKKVQGMDSFSVADMARLLLEEYDTDEATAMSDSLTLAGQWGKAGIIEGEDVPDGEIKKAAPDNVPSPAQEKKGEKKGIFRKIFG